MGEDRTSPLVAVVETVEDARQALRKARNEGIAAKLVSPPGAAEIHGVLWFAEMRRLLADEFADVRFQLMLDCGDRADLAHSALAEGLRCIRLSCRGPALSAILDVGKQLDAEIVGEDGAA